MLIINRCLNLLMVDVFSCCSVQVIFLRGGVSVMLFNLMDFCTGEVLVVKMFNINM